MRCLVYPTIGLLELALAGLLVSLSMQLPDAATIEKGFCNGQRVAERSGKQVRLLRQQVDDLRRPEVQELADRLQRQTRQVTVHLRSQAVDFEAIRALHEALGEVSKGLDSLAKTIDPSTVGKLSDGLGETANFLDNNVVPAAERAADQLEKSTEALRQDSQRLNKLLREAPLDLKAARDVCDSLEKFGDGLEKLNKALQPSRLTTMREGFEGMELSLTSGAEQVKRLSGFTYPQVAVDGLKVTVEQKKFWPEGDKIAEGMHKAAVGVREAGKELVDLAAEVPKVRTSLSESRKVVDKTREALASALKQQDKVEPLLKDLPTHAARLTEELPLLGGDLAKTLRDTRQLREVSKALRQAQKGVDTAVGSWPQLQRTLSKSGAALAAISRQTEQALKNRKEYEDAMQQTISMTETVASMLPLLTRQFNDQMADQEKGLLELEESLGEVGASLPGYANTSIGLVRTGRWVLWLVALILSIHGFYWLGSNWIGVHAKRSATETAA